jgi:hypothetical protein
MYHPRPFKPTFQGFLAPSHGAELVLFQDGEGYSEARGAQLGVQLGA